MSYQTDYTKDYEEYEKRDLERVKSYGSYKPLCKAYDQPKLEALIAQNLSAIISSSEQVNTSDDFQAEIRWPSSRLPQLWVGTPNQMELLFCTNSCYGGFDLTNPAKKWIAEERGSFFWYESGAPDDPESETEKICFPGDDQYHSEDRQNAWLVLCFLILGGGQINQNESDPLSCTRLCLERLPEDYYNQKFFHIREYDGLESLILDERVMKIWRQGQQEVAELNNTVKLMQQEIDELRSQLKEAQKIR